MRSIASTCAVGLQSVQEGDAGVHVACFEPRHQFFLGIVLVRVARGRVRLRRSVWVLGPACGMRRDGLLGGSQLVDFTQLSQGHLHD